MTAKIDGTNGVLQAYDYQTPTTGFSYTFAAGTQTLFMVPAATLATGTITMPASPADGMMITFSSSQQITALTLQGNTGQSISSAVTFLPAKTAAAYVYRLSNTTWYPTETVPGTGSQLVSGTVTASSGTALTYSSLPSWVKRITVMVASLQTSSTGVPIFQLSSSATFKTSGYLSSGGTTSAATAAASNWTTGFGIANNSYASTVVMHGSVVFTLLNSSTYLWCVSGVLGRSDAASVNYVGGSVTLAGVLDGIRLYIDGTQTFTAGSINILYE